MLSPIRAVPVLHLAETTMMLQPWDTAHCTWTWMTYCCSSPVGRNPSQSSVLHTVPGNMCCFSGDTCIFKSPVPEFYQVLLGLPQVFLLLSGVRLEQLLGGGLGPFLMHAPTILAGEVRPWERPNRCNRTGLVLGELPDWTAHWDFRVGHGADLTFLGYSLW